MLYLRKFPPHPPKRISGTAQYNNELQLNIPIRKMVQNPLFVLDTRESKQNSIVLSILTVQEEH